MVKEQKFSSTDGFQNRKHGKRGTLQAETIPVLETQPGKFNRDRPGNTNFRKNKVMPDAQIPSRDGSNVALRMPPPHPLFPANPDQYRRKPVLENKRSMFQRLPPQNNLKNKSDVPVGLFDLQLPDFDRSNVVPSVAFPKRTPPLLYSGQEMPTAMMAQHTPNERIGSTVPSPPQSAEDLMLKRLLALISGPEKTTPMNNPPMTNTLFRQNLPTQQGQPTMASTHRALNQQSMMAFQNTSSVSQFMNNLEMPTRNRPMGSNLQFDPKTAEDVLFHKKLMATETPRENPQMSKLKSLFEPKPLMEMVSETQQLTPASMAGIEDARHGAPIEKTTAVQNPQISIKSLFEPKPLMEMILEAQQLTPASMVSTGNALNEMMAASQNTSNVSQFNQNLMPVATEANNVVPEEQAKQEKMDKLLMMLTLLKRNENSEIVEMASSQEYGPMDGNSMEPNCNSYENMSYTADNNSQGCDQASPGNAYTDVEDSQADHAPYTKNSLSSSAGKSGKESLKDDLKAGSKKQSQKKTSDQGTRSAKPKQELRESGVPQEKRDKVDGNFVSPGSTDRSKELRKTNRPQEKPSNRGKPISRPFDPEQEQREGGMHYEKRGKVDRDFVSAHSAEIREELRKTNRPQERTSDQGIWSSRPSEYSEQDQREVGMRYEERGRVDRDFVSAFSAERQEEHRKTNRPQERTSDQGIWNSRPSDYFEQEQREVGMRHEKRGRLDRDFVSAPYAERPEEQRNTNRPQKRTSDQGIWSSRPSDYSELEQREVGMRYEERGRVDRDFVSPPFAERREELRKPNRPQKRTSDQGIWSSRPSDYSELEQREVGMHQEKHGRLDRDFVSAPSTDRREELRKTNRPQERTSYGGIGISSLFDEPKWAPSANRQEDFRKTNRPQERTSDRGIGISSLFDEPEWEQSESGVRHEKRGRLDRDFVSTPSTERQEKLRNTNRSQERTSDRGVWNSRPSDDPEWSQSESNMRYEKRGGLDRDLVSTPSTERWVELGRERNFDNGKWSSRPSDNIEWEQRESDMRYEKSGRLDTEFLAPRSTKGREAFKTMKQTRERTSDYDIQGPRPYEDPEWAQRDSDPHYEKRDRPNKKLISPRSTGRPINQSQERTLDHAKWSSRLSDDPEWAQRESGVCHEKHARLDRGFVSPRSTERWKKNPTDSVTNLPTDVLKRIKGKDSFTASAILSEYAERKSFK